MVLEMNEFGLEKLAHRDHGFLPLGFLVVAERKLGDLLRHREH